MHVSRPGGGHCCGQKELVHSGLPRALELGLMLTVGILFHYIIFSAKEYLHLSGFSIAAEDSWRLVHRHLRQAGN